VEGMVGAVLAQQGKKAEAQQAALQSFRYEAALRERLIQLYPRSTKLPEQQHELARSRWLIGTRLTELVAGNTLPPASLGEAQDSLTAALAAYDPLLLRNPGDTELLREVGAVYSSLADVQGLREDAASAKSAREKAAALYDLAQRAGKESRLALLLDLARVRPEAEWTPAIAEEAGKLVR